MKGNFTKLMLRSRLTLKKHVKVRENIAIASLSDCRFTNKQNLTNMMNLIECVFGSVEAWKHILKKKKQWKEKKLSMLSLYCSHIDKYILSPILIFGWSHFKLCDQNVTYYLYYLLIFTEKWLNEFSWKSQKG